MNYRQCKRAYELFAEPTYGKITMTNFLYILEGTGFITLRQFVKYDKKYLKEIDQKC